MFPAFPKTQSSSPHLSQVIAICFSLLVTSSAVASDNGQEVFTIASNKSCSNSPIQLTAGEKLERDLGGGECHSYRIALQSNQFLRVTVIQQGIDVVLTLYSLRGTELSRIDRPNGSRGPETISLIAPTDGSYQLTISSLEKVSARGKYELNVSVPRLARNDDLATIKAEQLISEGEKLRDTPGSLRDSATRFQQAADIWHSLGNPYEEALALYGAGYSCFSYGDNQLAINYIKRALAMFRQLKDVAGEAMAQNGLGWPFLYLSDLESAGESFGQAYELHRANDNLRGAGISLYGLGWVYALKGDANRALEKFSESLVWRRKVMDRNGEALTLTGIAKMQSRLNKFSEALDSLTLALNVLPENKVYAQADILSNLGWIHKARNDNDKALAFFTDALQLRRQAEDAIGEATTRFGMSVVLRNSARFSEAETEIEEALRIIESLRATGSNQQLKISYFASIQDYYEFYITLLIELDRLHPSQGYAAKALHACERARARGLLDLLTEARVDMRHGVDPALLERERTHYERLNELAIERGSLPNSKDGVVEATDKTFLAVRNDLETVRAEIRRQNPGYAALMQVEPLTAAEIQKQILDDNTLLLEYMMFEQRSFLLAATADEVTSYELPPRADIESVAREYYEAITVRNQPDVPQNDRSRKETAQADAKAEVLAQRLSRILLRPVSDKLKKSRLVILTSGTLQLIPFAALPVPSDTTASRVLIDDHAVIALPSITALSMIRRDVKERTRPPKTVIVLGDPVFDRSDSRLKSATANASSAPQFPRLISSRWEAEKILSLVPRDKGKIVLDFAANRGAATSGEFGEYRFVHFATHALIDLDHPPLSGVVLSMVDENGKPQNGFLGMEDIFNLRLPVDMVVLSGCQTALGRDYAGEGLMSLTRAFMYAGAARVGVSLWQVADRPTSELMVRFYKHMLGPEKLTPPAALRAAQLELRKDPRWQSPYFWAPFVIQGEWR